MVAGPSCRGKFLLAVLPSWSPVWLCQGRLASPCHGYSAKLGAGIGRPTCCGIGRQALLAGEVPGGSACIQPARYCVP